MSAVYLKISIGQKGEALVEGIKQIVNSYLRITRTAYKNEYRRYMASTEVRWLLDITCYGNLEKFRKYISPRNPVVIQKIQNFMSIRR